MQLKVSPISRQECSAEEWQARVDLAAAHRMAVMHGFHEGIFNHLTLAVPGKPDRYYQIPFGMHWSEVKASSFMEVGIDDGKVKRGAGDVERSCYCIHAPIHKAAAASRRGRVPHPHALRQRADAARGPAHQGDRPDRGRHDRQDRLRRQLHRPGLRAPRRASGSPSIIGDKSVLFMANHGITTVGATVAEAYDRLYYIERAAQVQIYAMWTGQPLKQLPEPVVEKTMRDIGGAQLLRRPHARRAPLRGAQAHPRPQGARLRGVAVHGCQTRRV